jgi:hypothetical protein
MMMSQANVPAELELTVNCTESPMALPAASLRYAVTASVPLPYVSGSTRIVMVSPGVIVKKSVAGMWRRCSFSL